MTRTLSSATATATSTVTAALAIGLAAPLMAQDLPGYELLPVQADHRARTLEASVWYPLGTPTYKGMQGDNPIFEGTRAYVGAAPAPGTYPLVILVHGSGGRIDTLGWLTGPLASRGAIVAGVNHHGATSGDSSPRRSLQLANPARDIAATIDMLLADPTFGPLINPDDITVVGFSLGGAVALSQAGIQPVAQTYADYCAGPGADQMDCVFFAKGGIDLAALGADFEHPPADPRITRIVAIDPGLTAAANPAQVAAVDKPVHVLNLYSASDVPLSLDITAHGLDTTLPGIEHHFVEGAHHFDFLALCKANAQALLEEEGEDPICTPSSRPRAEVHAKVIDRVTGYIFD